jgi:outer membrane cobalamin receptor
MRSHNPAITALLLSAALPAAAATNQLSELVVTASRMPEPRRDIPAAVTVFDRSEIRNAPAWNVDDLLQSAAGIGVLRSVGLGYGVPSQINIRGVPGQHAVLLLVDGLPLNDAISGYAGVNEVPVEAVDRIEAVRGPFSSVYGTDAFAGVINLLTPDPATAPGLEGYVRLGNEDFREYSAAGSAGTRAEGVLVRYSTRTIDNALAQDRVIDRQWNPMTQTYVETSRPAENYDYEDRRFLAKVTLDLNDHVHIDLHGRYYDATLGYGVQDRRPLYPEPADDIMDSRTAAGGATLEAVLSDTVSLRGRAYYREQKRDLLGLDIAGVRNGVPLFARSQSDAEAADWLADGGVVVELGEHHHVAVGGDFYRDDVDFSPLRDAATGAAFPLSSGRKAHIYNWGVYGHDRLRLRQDLHLVAALRVDEHSTFGTAVSPKAGVLLDLSERTILRTSVGRAYRAPTLTELYQPTVSFGTTTFESNADLDPEYIVSADAGVEHRLSDALSGTLDVFYNDMDGLITKRISGSTLTFDNADRAWSSGVELGVEWTPVPGTVLFANYTGIVGEDEETGEDLEHIPGNTLNAGIRVGRRLRDCLIELCITENRVGKRGYLDLASGRWQELDAYWRTDASMRVTFNDTFWLGVNVANATDETYQEWTLVNPAPGRLYAFEAGCRYW